jgi:hypothetical protein
MQVEHHLAAGGFVELLDRDAIGLEHCHGPWRSPARPWQYGRDHPADVENLACRTFEDDKGVAGCARHDVEERERSVAPGVQLASGVER